MIQLDIPELVVIRRGQRWRLVGTVPFTRRSGEAETFLRWDSTCCDCGAAYQTQSPATFEYLTRRCPACIAKRRKGS